MKTILRIIAHYFLTQPQRISWAFILLFEAAFVRKGQTLRVEMTVYDENSRNDIEVQYIGPGEFKAWFGEPPNNTNPETRDHLKGDF